MAIIEDISDALQRGKRKEVTKLVKQALEEGADATLILKDGLLDGMNIIGEKFKNDEVFVPEVLVAARAMNAGTALLKPYLSDEAAEPLAGLLSPDLAQEFSADYVKQIVEAVQDDEFLVVYHNCGNSAVKTIDTIVTNGCRVFHFGNAIDMEELMGHVPENMIAMGNVDPAGEFRNGTPESIREKTREVMEKCCRYPNFVISSGCDIPPMSPWENIRSFFDAVDEYYA